MSYSVRIADEIWDGPSLRVKDCRRSVNRRLRALPTPKTMIPAERMAARAILAPCKACGGCERAL